MADTAVANPFTTEQARDLKPAQASTDVAVQRELAEVQAAVLMARRFPRDPIQAMDNILRACTRPSLAQGALYQYARGGTEITGPSIRLAEVMAQVWGNLSFGVRELEQRPGESTMEAYCWDMETNVRQSRVFQVRHERHTRGGAYKLTDPRDVYEQNANLGARRLRACILGVIPGDVREAAVAQCEETLQAEADTSQEGLAKLVEAFAQFGISKEQIEIRCQRRMEAIRSAQVVQLRKIWASLRDEMSQPGDWFQPVAPTAAAAAPTIGNQALRERLGQKTAPASREAGPSQPGQTPAETGDRTPAGPAGVPATGDEPEGSQAAAAGELPLPGGIPVVKPQRAPRPRSGWDWPRFVDELLAIAETLLPEDLAALRGANKSMIDSLQASDKAEWSRLLQALTALERAAG